MKTKEKTYCASVETKNNSRLTRLIQRDDLKVVYEL